MLFRNLAIAATTLVLSSPIGAQELPLGPRSDFGRVVLSNNQVSGGAITLEQVFGSGFDSEPAYQYPEISGYRKMGRAVGRLDIATDKGTAHCTGFLISDRHLMTNGHCLMIAGAKVQAVNFVTGYVENGIVEGTRSYSVNIDPIEISGPDDLDYAILEVFGAPAQDWGTLPLSAFAFDSATHAGLPLIVIGHPAKMAQHISRKECRAAARKPLANNRLRHTCDTLVGNSGSPVIGEDGRKVLALHHAGDSVNGMNFAVPMALIAERSPIVAALTAPTSATPVVAADVPEPDRPEPAAPVRTIAPAKPATPDPAPAAITRAKVGDWEIRCHETDHDSCQMYQLLHMADGTAVAEVQGFPIPGGGAAVAGFTVTTPKETLLSKGLQLRVDNGETLKFDFSRCIDSGCFARLGISPKTLDQMRRGRTLTITIYPAAAPDTAVAVTASLKGFTDAFAGLSPSGD